MRALVEHVAEFYAVPIERLRNPDNRSRSVIEARQMACWIVSETMPHLRYDAIAELVGYRERSGPSHAIASIERRLRTDDNLVAALTMLRAAVAA